jgi:DNA polymerase-3 subunit epsilon
MKVRQIVLDTETTGLFPQEGNRIIQVAAVEMLDGKATGKRYNTYINPERDSHPEALKVHGLTTEFLADKPKFIAIVDEFLKFIEGAELIIHNAPFDLGFLNHELNLINRPALTNAIVDTRIIAQQLYSKEFLTIELISKKLVEDEDIVREQKAKSDSDASLIAGLIANSKFRVHSLDHLCKYFGIDLSSRERHHGALVDCELLGRVYFHLKQEQVKNEADKATRVSAPIEAANSSVVNVSIFQPDKIQTQEREAPGVQDRKSVTSP